MKILLIASISQKKNRLDGVTIKSRVLKEYLEKNKKIDLEIIDVDNWKKRFLVIIYNILKKYKNTDKIVLFSSSKGASWVLKFLYKIKNQKDVYYFVAGGTLAKRIKEGKYNINIYKPLKKIYVESNKMKEEFKEIGLINNVEVVYNFRKVDQFENKYKENNEIRFVFYGRVIKEKGIEEAINVINRLVRKNENVSLDIYGQCKEEYLQYLKSLSCDRINFKGAIKPDNKKEYEILSQYDVFLLPTEHIGEGLPGALIDAYIAGLAVIVSNWEFATEYVKNNENGLIFEYKNYEDFYKKTKKMISENKIKHYKDKSREMAQNFLVDNVLGKVINEITSEE